MTVKKKHTISDIALEAGVSKTTVSFFLNGKRDKMTAETWARVEAVVKKYDYRPSTAARMLGAQHSGLIGVLICDITNSFANHMVKGIEEVCRNNGQQILIGNTDYDPIVERQHIERMIDMKIDGLIWQPTAYPKEQIEKLEKAGIPLVCIDSKPPEVQHWVVTNNYRATFDAVSTCLKKGYDHCLMFAAEPDSLISRRERFDGCVEAATALGIPCHVEILDNETAPSTILQLAQAHMAAHNSQHTLIFVPNCWLLPQVFGALQPLHSKMPQKFGLLGFDNAEWAGVSSPSVSTILQPDFQEGKAAATILCNIIRQVEGQNTTVTMPCHMVWRGSTAL